MQRIGWGRTEPEGCVEVGRLVVEGVHQEDPDSDSIGGGESRQDRVAQKEPPEA